MSISLFVAFFVLVPMAQRMFQAADIPRRLMPATIGLGAFTFTMTALPGTPSVNNAIPMPYFGTTTFAAPGIGIVASLITLAFGLWWLARAEALERAEIVGIAKLLPDRLEMPPVAVRRLPEQAAQMRPQVIGHAVVVEQRVVDIQQEDDVVGHGCSACLSCPS